MPVQTKKIGKPTNGSCIGCAGCQGLCQEIIDLAVLPDIVLKQSARLR